MARDFMLGLFVETFLMLSQLLFLSFFLREAAASRFYQFE